MGAVFQTEAQFLSKTREFLRDKPELNALLDSVETSDFLITLSRDLTIDDFNTTPPLIGNFTFFGFPSDYLLLMGTLVQIFKSAGFLQSRNQLDYAEGGLTVQTSNKTPLYQSWINFLATDYEIKKLQLKKSINAESTYGSVSSEYVQVNFGGNLVFFGLDSVNLVRNGIFI